MKKILTSISVLLSAITLFPGAAQSQQQVTVGTGTLISVFSPINRTNDYSVYEVIYLASDIATAGNITHLAFWRYDGDDTAAIQNVDLYMRHTIQTQQAAGTFDTTGYTHVYSGTFPNETGSGWRQVMLNTSFMYNGSDNLEVLVVKGYQPAVAGPPVCVRWHYTNISPAPDRARRYYGSTPVTSSTSLATIEFSSNVRLTFDIGTGSVEIIPEMFYVFPNPVANELKIKNSELKIKLIEIYNFLGEKIFSQKLTANSRQPIDVSFLPPGIYIVNVFTEGKMYVKKVVKE